MWQKILLGLWIIGAAPPGLAAEPFTQGAAQGPVYLYQTPESFDVIKENLEMAITNRGLLISGTLHVSDMLQRTGKDLGFADVYTKAESVEFCSALFSHKMTQAHPANLVVCPFTIALYSLPARPDRVYVAFRKQYLANDEAGILAKEIEDFLHGIAREALELD